ncbi:MAG TPA: hypothetical protein VFE82_18670 [Ramlibacter sp.]|jgi:type III secretion protein X|uniref:type III secretion apparatus assembly protein SctX n=1 Tax=Ramlibacter sp. TaxID=1917967 RepID=UPI002D2A4C62|nr:hypothetical protein [Ramlibacter sp.]HZY20500.1 hypothetical protein [Ramlibacter sp.]
MSDFRIGSGPFFDRGIDSITFRGSEGSQGLPGQQELVPAEQGQRPQLEQLLAMPNLDAFLEDAIRPEIGDRELLMPQRFRQTLDSALASLRDEAERLQASDPESARVLGRASRVIAEEQGLRDLVQMYRSVLYQG